MATKASATKTRRTDDEWKEIIAAYDAADKSGREKLAKDLGIKSGSLGSTVSQKRGKLGIGAKRTSGGPSRGGMDISAYTVSALTKLYLNAPKVFHDLGNRLALAEDKGRAAELEASIGEERKTILDMQARGILTEKEAAAAIKRLEASVS